MFCSIKWYGPRQVAVPHCVEKFRPTFGILHWPSTCRHFHFANFDRSVLDFSWKVAHGVVLTAQRLISFGLHVSQHCFCGPVLESLSHLLFACLLRRVDCLGSSR